jgi:hypothetical protein
MIFLGFGSCVVKRLCLRVDRCFNIGWRHQASGAAGPEPKCILSLNPLALHKLLDVCSTSCVPCTFKLRMRRVLL